MLKFIYIIIAYLFGTIPFGIIFGKIAHKKDLRKSGSGNIGATNAFRTYGKVYGFLTFLFDFLKGFIPVLVTKILIMNDISMLPTFIYGFSAVLGHCVNVFLKFKGGKGASTSIGVLMAFDFRIGLICLVVAFILIAVTKMVSVATLSTCFIALILIVIFDLVIDNLSLNAFLLDLIPATFTVLLVFIRHSDNITRLIQKKENKIYLFKKEQKKED